MIQLCTGLSIAAAAFSVVLTGCGGGATDNSITPSVPGSITIVPSLGVVTNATVSVYKANGNTLLGTVGLTPSGQATLNFNDYSGPVMIEVVGGANGKYFDEAKNSLVNFTSNDTVHAISPSSSGVIAVTILTELAYQGAIAKGYFPLDSSRVREINQRVRLATVPEIADLLVAPTSFDSGTSPGELANNDSGKYAVALAALAWLGQTQSAPSLAVMRALTKDMVDGDFDGKDAANVSVSAPYSNFSSEFVAKRITVATNFGATELINAMSGYPQLKTSINLGDIPAGNIGHGGNELGVTISPALGEATLISMEPFEFKTKRVSLMTQEITTWKSADGSAKFDVSIWHLDPNSNLPDQILFSLFGNVGSSSIISFSSCVLATSAMGDVSSCSSLGVTLNAAQDSISFANAKVQNTNFTTKQATFQFILNGSLRLGSDNNLSP